MAEYTTNRFRHGSLFSGIGGFDLAAEWMGWENIFHCEWMPFPRKVLNHYWPNSISYEDITKTDFSIHRGSIDILTGGFPCQPYSSAGKRLGKEDERHLWPHMLRAIREIEPTFVVGENVRGLTNWNGGVVFEEVCSELEACGYEVQPLLLPACSVGAPHRRDRVWFVAYSNGSGNGTEKFRSLRQKDGEISRKRTQTIYDAIRSDGNERTSTDSNGSEQTNIQGTNGTTTNQVWGKNESNVFRELCSNGMASDSNGIGLWSESYRIGKSGFINKNSDRNDWENFPTQSPICSGDDGIPNQLDGITFSNWRKESLKGYGNAIVPQVAYQIFKTIEYLTNNEKTEN